MIARQIRPNELAGFLAQPEPNRLFREGVASTGHRLNVADVTHLLHSGHMQLWAAFEDEAPRAQVLSEVVTYPRMKVLRLFGLAGANLKELAALLPTIKAWGAERGCSELDAIETRPGLEVVIPDFKRAGVCLVMPIAPAHEVAA
jgi:hypothetical protein